MDKIIHDFCLCLCFYTSYDMIFLLIINGKPILSCLDKVYNILWKYSEGPNNICGQI